MTTRDIEKRSAEARRLLIQLCALLDKEGETNWRRGIEAAIGELSNANGDVDPGGFDGARSIYKTMTAGGRGFSEYYIQRSSEKARLEANEILDNLRSGLWAAFDL